MRQRAQAIIIRDNKVLFGYGLIEGRFIHYFIGGGLEQGEQPHEGVLREVKEEANVDGKIIFKLSTELREGHHTFLVDIGEQEDRLGYDPEQSHLTFEEKQLQKLLWLNLNDKTNFTDIDINYFRLLVEECKKNNYLPSWYDALKKLVG